MQEREIQTARVERQFTILHFNLAGVNRKLGFASPREQSNNNFKMTNKTQDMDQGL